MSFLSGWAATEQDSHSLQVHLLGVLDYESALLLQEMYVYELSGRTDTLGGLLLCEHPPLITVGREGSGRDIKVDSRELLAHQMQTRYINRGGGTVVHGPGQLAVYPLLPLKRLGLGLRDYRDLLEQTVLNVCEERSIPAHQRSDSPGVFSRRGQLASIGIAVKSWVSWQGMFLNVSPSLKEQQFARANRVNEPVSSLSVDQPHTILMPKVRESLIRHFAREFGYFHYQVQSGHPLLTRIKKKSYDSA